MQKAYNEYSEVARIIEEEAKKQKIEKDKLTRGLFGYIKKNLNQF